MRWQEAIDKAQSLGASYQPACNWDWANKFPSEEAAKTFNEWCEKNGYETRGVYGPLSHANGWCVRYRNKMTDDLTEALRHLSLSALREFYTRSIAVADAIRRELAFRKEAEERIRQAADTRLGISCND